MGEEDDNERVTIVEERLQNMVPLTGETPTLRIARFIEPSMAYMGEAVQVPLALPLPRPKALKIRETPPDINFVGWKPPQRIWAQWVDQLGPMYGHVWNKSGIYESIINSTYKFIKDKELIIGLADSWCSDANTFTFSWGEATMTLEDMFVLQGFSVLGKPVTSPLTEELMQIKEKMIKERKGYQSKARKAQQCEWVKLFIGSNDDLEHIAFLSLWLSRFVLPSKPEETMTDLVFPIAIHLSKSTQIALAPAVLASLYRDLRLLRLLKEKVDASSSIGSCENNESPLSIWAPFQIMQLWAWERFLTLQPTPNSLNPGESRAARWHNLKSKTKFDSVRSSISSPDNFLWRPYSSVLNNCKPPLYYKDEAEWVLVSVNTNTELLSLTHFVVPCELVGLDCIEQYLPHKVGMQFGMDQDIPGPFTRSNANWEIAWKTYDKHMRNIALYIPARLFESDVTVEYFDWWNQYISACPLGISCQTVELPSSNDEDKMTISEWFKHQRSPLTKNKEEASSDVHISSAPVQSSSSTTKENINGMKPSITDNDKTLCSKVPMSRNIGYEDNSTEIVDSIDILLDTCCHEVVTDTDELQLPRLDLEVRIGRLEVVVDRLNVVFGRRKK